MMRGMLETVSRSASPAPPAPPAAAFPQWPIGWYAAAPSDRIGRQPIGVDLFGRRIVVYRSRAGGPIAMDARCWHMGADLSAGRVIDDCIQCPFHGWKYSSDGRCTSIPAQPGGAGGAHQQIFCSAETAGRVFVFSPDRPAYPLPFFRGTSANELAGAPPFTLEVGCPWWLATTNGFDLQHFAEAHDRRLIGEPAVSSPHPSARRIISTFEVTGTTWRDALVRHRAGRLVTMDITVWSGTLVFIIATFRDGGPDAPVRTESFGMTEIIPRSGAADTACLARVTLFVRRRGPLDPIRARIRSNFVRAFLRNDVHVLNGTQYRPERLIVADATLIQYLRWLAPASAGIPIAEENP
jgi:nitrite reductase/ring-hydroxylating ferredoxin subunit